VFRVMKYKTFHNTNRENKRYNGMYVKVALHTIFQRFEYHTCINIVFRWQKLANHIALG